AADDPRRTELVRGIRRPEESKHRSALTSGLLSVAPFHDEVISVKSSLAPLRASARLLLATCIVFALPRVAYPQLSTPSVTGVLRDPAERVVPDALVVMLNV